MQDNEKKQYQQKDSTGKKSFKKKFFKDPSRNNDGKKSSSKSVSNSLSRDSGKPFYKSNDSHKKKGFSSISARRAAFYLLEAPLIENRPLLHVENQILRRVEQKKDRALARMIAYTALRHNNELDCIIDAYATDGIKTPEVRVFLKVGLTQILYMEVPNHASVSETVSALFGRALPLKGLVNAILRKATTEGKEFLENHKDIVNIPKYLWRSWVSAYGEKTARIMLDTFQEISPIDIAVKSQAETWAKELEGLLLPNGAIRLKNVDSVTSMKGYEDGQWWVQDFAAQVPVTLFGEDLAGKTIIDLCAAPGGKTAQLLARGARVIAVDSNARRLSILKENMKRLGYGEDVLTIIQQDAVTYRPEEKVDGVLLDAPCSATGTIRKNPDLPFLKNINIIRSTAKLQREMLKNAQGMLKKDGVLVFATCSLQPEEGEEHIKRIPSMLKISPIRRREIKGMEKGLSLKGFLRLLPHFYKEIGGMDGFFVARFVKILED